MDLKDLSDYIKSLLRSDAEVITAFFMGGLVTAMIGFWLRLWKFQKNLDGEIARKDAEIARLVLDLALAEIAKKDKDAELARKDRQVADSGARAATSEGRSLELADLLALLRQRDATLTEQNAAMETLCAGLNGENNHLRQAVQAAEADSATLRTQLVHALAEARHWAKWYKNIEEENARLAESASLQED
jgi:chromosome segregation ATPase